jgi:urease subunit alpha
MWGAAPQSAQATSLHFVSESAIADGLADRVNIGRKFAPIKNTRGVGKADMPENNAQPDIQVNPSTFEVHIDGELVTEQPASSLPMTQRYFLF